MTNDKILDLLKSLKQGNVSIEEAHEALKCMPYEDLNHTKIDYHRGLRKGLQEVVFGEGKQLGQILDIIGSMRRNSLDVLVTRIDTIAGEKIREAFPEGTYNHEARCFYIKEDHTTNGKGTVVVMSAGTSDSKVAEEAYITSTFFGNRTERVYDVGVAGIHRLFDNMDVLKEARAIIVAAGMEGALPSVVAGMVGVPVIGVPTSVGYGASFGGLAALLGMLNSCSTISVFNIDNGFGAAYFATLINRL